MSTPPPPADFKQVKEAYNAITQLAMNFAADAEQATGGGHTLIYTKSRIDSWSAQLLKHLSTIKGYIAQSLINQADQAMQECIDKMEQPGLGALDTGSDKLNDKLEFIRAIGEEMEGFTNETQPWSGRYVSTVGKSLLSAHEEIVAAILQRDHDVELAQSGFLGSMTIKQIMNIRQSMAAVATANSAPSAYEIDLSSFRDTVNSLMRVLNKNIPKLEAIITPNPDDPPADLTEQMVHQMEHGDENCGSCKFWRKIVESDHCGGCYLNPPVPLSVHEGAVHYAIPETKPESVCGQFQPRSN